MASRPSALTISSMAPSERLSYTGAKTRMGSVFFAPGRGVRDAGGGNADVSSGSGVLLAEAAIAAPAGITAAANKPLPVFVRNSLRFMESEFEPVAIKNS